jgi:tetratricopeptide (TPR) repeat protein
MPRTTDLPAPTRTAPRSTGLKLGERVRQLRMSAGMTQSGLAGDRFSKEYVSQIERGKTRPTKETIEWLAARLGVDACFLANGVSANERGRIETVLTRAEALTEDHRYDEAIGEYEKISGSIEGIAAPELEVRALGGEAWARMQEGQLREASGVLDRARELTENPSFSDVDRADVLFRLGVCRYKLQSVSTALALFNEALMLAERSGMPCDLLRSNVLGWRSRCYRRQRDFEAAREDVERALELAEGLNDRRTVAHVYFQASLVAERDGHWVLARGYAERAKAQYEEIADRANVGKLLNNLGGLNFLLGKPDEAVA